MCGRFALDISPDILSEIFCLTEVPQFQPRYNIAPSQHVLVARQTTDRRTHLDVLQWGLIPSWAKDASMGGRLINARCESVHEKPAFRYAIKHRRCLVPSSGFIEWETVGGKKFPYYVCKKDRSPMVFAGLWELWKSPEGQQKETCAILTTSANKVVEAIHNRMPVILHPSKYNMWLDRDLHDTEVLKHLYAPYPAYYMEMYEISPHVNRPQNDSAELILPLVPASPPSLFST